MKDPDTLTIRILKAKYYPGSSILEAKVGSKPSFAWRSIQGVGNIIKEGTSLRIGNGSEVKIWGEPWIPTLTTFRIQSTLKVLNSNFKVEELIDPNTQWWRTNLLQEMFCVEEAKIVTSILIASLSQPNMRI
jgi:hypothetical protein